MSASIIKDKRDLKTLFTRIDKKVNKINNYTLWETGYNERQITDPKPVFQQRNINPTLPKTEDILANRRLSKIPKMPLLLETDTKRQFSYRTYPDGMPRGPNIVEQQDQLQRSVLEDSRRKVIKTGDPEMLAKFDEMVARDFKPREDLEGKIDLSSVSSSGLFLSRLYGDEDEYDLSTAFRRESAMSDPGLSISSSRRSSFVPYEDIETLRKLRGGESPPPVEPIEDDFDLFDVKDFTEDEMKKAKEQSMEDITKVLGPEEQLDIIVNKLRGLRKEVVDALLDAGFKEGESISSQLRKKDPKTGKSRISHHAVKRFDDALKKTDYAKVFADIAAISSFEFKDPKIFNTLVNEIAKFNIRLTPREMSSFKPEMDGSARERVFSRGTLPGLSQIEGRQSAYFKAYQNLIQELVWAKFSEDSKGDIEHRIKNYTQKWGLGLPTDTLNEIINRIKTYGS